MKNTMKDLNDHLFEMMERLNDEELSEDDLQVEIKRAKAMEGIAARIIDNNQIALQTAKFMVEFGIDEKKEAINMIGIK